MSQANRLILEKSPYLLQHAQNPVDWYPWGPEAFEKARAEDKPIFLSIGYSTCHWCHVMEHESFEDPEVARLMNEAFVSIKVDREERPDIDQIYMTVCQMLTGSGGWPLTIFMTPDKKPFFAGTYFPKESRFGQIGMLELIPRIKELWQMHRKEMLESADQVTAMLQRSSNNISGEELSGSTLRAAYEQLADRFDEEHGGFGTAPKFPTPHHLLFLLRYWKRTGTPKALEMVEKTLHAMQHGGIYDHLGFGIHRYSTDAQWLLSHFEKMLYDQALLAMAYTEAYQATGKEEFQLTAREIFEYVRRDMTAPAGGFYSAEDADSEGEEGRFYVWTLDEIRQTLSHDEAQLVIKAFNLEEGGNFSEQATGRKTSANILYLSKAPQELATDFKLSVQELQERLRTAQQKLFTARETRVRPHKDDKILTDWNGLMIAALAKAAQAFDEPDYAKAAQSAADFILTQMRDATGRLLHRYRDGEAAVLAHLDDYAFLIWGLLELYEATFETRYLQTALDLNRDLIAHFWDGASGGFYFTANDAESLLIRPKEVYDGAVPSGNSIAMLNLLRLGRMTANTEFEAKAAQIGRTFAREIQAMPSAHTQLMMAVDFALGPSHEVVIVGDLEKRDTRGMLRALHRPFVPNKVVLFRPSDGEVSEITRLAPFTQSQKTLDGKATAYVCQNYRCKLPTADIEKMLELL